MKQSRWICVGVALLGLAGCFGSDGVPSTDGTTGGNKPVIDVGPSPPPGGNDEVNKKPPPGGDPTVGANVTPILIPAPQVSATLLGKSVVQDGLYAVGKLQAHAVDSKNQASTFHWILTGSGIADAVYGDGVDFSYDLPAAADKSAYELVVIGTLGGKAVQEKLDFFTVPAATATITANVNQAGGIAIALPDKGSVLKGQKIVFSADTKFADQYKWQISKDNAPAADFGKPNAPAEFPTDAVGNYTVALSPSGVGGTSPAAPFNFTVKDNGATITVKSKVVKDTFPETDLANGGQYPIKSKLSVDASDILPAEALSSVVCTLKNNAGVEQAPSSKTATTFNYALDTDDQYALDCTYTLKPDYAPAAGNALSSVTHFTVLTKTKAVVMVDGNACDPNAPPLYTKGAGVMFDATNSTGNATNYSWNVFLNGNPFGKPVAGIQNPLNLTGEGTYTITLNVEGIGDSDPATCTVTAKAAPSVFFADETTVEPGRSYIMNSFQSAHAKVISGEVTDFTYDLLDAAKLPLVPPQTQTFQDLNAHFDFQLAASGGLTLKLQPKFKTIVGDPTYRPFFSKLGQVSLVTPIDLTGIQSVASADNVYLASPAAIFHLGQDNRIVKVADIGKHLASPNGFYVRSANDVRLLTTDGGVWRYSYDKGWNHSDLGLPNNDIAVVMNGISSNGPLFVLSKTHALYRGDSAGGNWKPIASNKRFLTVAREVPYVAEAQNIAIDKAVPPDYTKGSTPGVFKCSELACTELAWAPNMDPKAKVIWRPIGGSGSSVIAYLSDANKNVYIANNGKVSKLGVLKNDLYIATYARSSNEVVFAMGNTGGVYRLTPKGMSVVSNPPPLVVKVASGSGSTFVVWNDAKKALTYLQGANQKDVTSQPALGTTVPGPGAGTCAPQKMWMVGDTAYVSACAGIPGKLFYTVWSAPQSGDFAKVPNLVMPEPVVGIDSDGADGLLVARSDVAKNLNYIQHLDVNGALVVPAPNVPPNTVITGLSGKFLTTNQGILAFHAPDYVVASQDVTDAQHAVAVGDVLYYSFAKNTRLGKYDVIKNTSEQLASVPDPADPIVDIVVDGSRVYVLTAKALYRNDGAALTKLYTTPAGASIMNAMAIMNGRHFLLSFNSKGLKLVDKDGQEVPMNQDAMLGLPLAIQSVGYNGTEFLFYGYDMQTKALFLHQFGAPQ